MSLRVLAGIFAVGAMVLGTSVAHSQDPSTGSGQVFPAKPIRIITAEPGGVSDLGARLIAQGLTASVGQPVLVDNRGGGAIAAPMVAKAAPDGHTLLYHGSNIWLLPLMQTVPYDPVKELSPITQAGGSPNLLVVHPALPVKSVKELIVLAKARPGDLSYAGGTTGSTIHIASELFKSMAGVKIVRIPYKGTAQALNDVIAGHVQVMIPNAGSGSPHVKSGRLRALAVTSAQPSALLPGLPTVAASGVPGYEAVAMTALFAPANTPVSVIRRLNQEVVRVLHLPDVKQKFMDSGVEVVGSSPEQFDATMKSDMTRISKVIKDAGIRAE